MDESLRFALTLVDHGGDTDLARRWFTAVDEAYLGPDGPVGTWDDFRARFRETAGSHDSAAVDRFVERMAAQLSDPLDAVRGLHELGPDQAATAADRERAPAVAEPAVAEPAPVPSEQVLDWNGFAELLRGGARHHRKSWPFFRGWLVSEAGDRELIQEARSFVAHVEGGADRAEALALYGAAGATAEPEHTQEPEPVQAPAPEYEQAAAAVRDIAVEVLQRMRVSRPDLTVTDDTLARVLAERLHARSTR